MKAKITRGKGFKGVLSYLLSTLKCAKILGGTMDGRSSKGLLAEFNASRALRPACKNPVWHCSLSLPPGEKLSDKQWLKIANQYMRKMDFEPIIHQFVIIRHGDRNHEHIHILASRISLTGEIWHGRKEVYQAISATQQIEKEFGLVRTPGLKYDGSHRRGMDREEIEQALSSGDAPPRVILQNAIDQALVGRPTIAAFVERLENAGIQVRPNIVSTGRMNGFSFQYKNRTFKASQLGKKYTWSNLQKRGLDYLEKRDHIFLTKVLKKTPKHSSDLEKGQEGENPKRFSRVLDLAFYEREPGIFTWRYNKRVAIRDLGDAIKVHSYRPSAIKAAVQLALQKSWSTIQITTSDQAKALEIYRQARLLGYPKHAITFVKYKPQKFQIETIEKEVSYGQAGKSTEIESTEKPGNLRTNRRAEPAAGTNPDGNVRPNSSFGRSVNNVVPGSPAGYEANNGTASRCHDKNVRFDREVDLSGKDNLQGTGEIGKSGKADRKSICGNESPIENDQMENSHGLDSDSNNGKPISYKRICDLAATIVANGKESVELVPRIKAETSAAGRRPISKKIENIASTIQGEPETMKVH